MAQINFTLDTDFLTGLFQPSIDSDNAISQLIRDLLLRQPVYVLQYQDIPHFWIGDTIKPVLQLLVFLLYSTQIIIQLLPQCHKISRALPLYDNIMRIYRAVILYGVLYKDLWKAQQFPIFSL